MPLCGGPISREYAVVGSRWMDCIGRWESDRAYREIASQHSARTSGSV